MSTSKRGSRRRDGSRRQRKAHYDLPAKVADDPAKEAGYSWSMRKHRKREASSFLALKIDGSPADVLHRGMTTKNSATGTGDSAPSGFNPNHDMASSPLTSMNTKSCNENAMVALKGYGLFVAFEVLHRIGEQAPAFVNTVFQFLDASVRSAMPHM